MTGLILATDTRPVIKQDVSFLEYPLWRPERRDKKAEFVITTREGRYVYKAKPGNIPDDMDALFLYFFLLVAQRTKRNKNEFITHRVLKELELPANKQNYERILTTLERWSDVSIKFEGTFYVKEKVREKDGTEKTIKRYIDKGFHILKYEYIREEKRKKGSSRTYKSHKFKVAFDDDFIQSIEDSAFIKYIDINKFKAAGTPLGRRLYEWLPKQLINRDTYKIKHDTFFQKMRIIPGKYPSEIQRKLKSVETAVRKINQNEEEWQYRINYELKKKPEGRYFLITFTREEKIQPESDQHPLPFYRNKQVRLTKDEITEKLKEIGFQGIEKIRPMHSNEVWVKALMDLSLNIRNKQKTGGEIENPGGWLRAMLPEPGKPYKFTPTFQKHSEAEEAKKKAEKRGAEEAKERAKRDAEEAKERAQNAAILEAIEALPAEDRQRIEKEAEERVLKERGKGAIGISLSVRFEKIKLYKDKYEIPAD